MIESLNWSRFLRRMAIQKCLPVAEDEYPGLHQWVRTIRSRKGERLSQDQLQHLEKLNFCWNAREEAWTNHYSRLLQFKSKHGHCRVPNNSQEYPGLGIWVRNQRREHMRWKRGEPSTLTTQRREALEEVGFTWNRNHTAAWKTRYRELCDFVKEHGHSNVPQCGGSLGSWCMNQRVAYRRYYNGQSTALTSDRIELLNKIDFSWHVRNSNWNTMFERLTTFHEMHNHTNIPVSDATQTDLRFWVIRQRFKYNADRLSPERKQALDPMAGDWQRSESSTADWAQLLDAIRQRGIQPGMPAKQHWFDGSQRFEETPSKEQWTEQDLLELWNQEPDDDDF